MRSWLRLDDRFSDRLGLGSWLRRLDRLCGRRLRCLDRLCRRRLRFLDLDSSLCRNCLGRSDRLTLEDVDLSVVFVALLLKFDSGANRGDAGSNGACSEEEDSHVKILRV